ncbi:MAG: DNA polymerase III subunit delta' [bacterium]|nr:DNA polymerase III subunit delta' [bacterium]
MGWDDILGQPYAVKILQNSIRFRRIPQAFLFFGEKGVGKRLTATHYAKVINCEKGGLDCCDDCLSCQMVDNNNHPDVRSISPENGRISISEIRSLKKETGLTPVYSRRKVYIISEADKMTEEAQNSLLKTLEEPPLDTLLILTATFRNNLFPTIISRCQQIRFSTLSNKIIEEVLENLGVRKDRIPYLITLSGGSLGRAKEYLNRKVPIEEEWVLDLIDRVNRYGVNEIFKISQQILDKKRGMDVLDVLVAYFHRCVKNESDLPFANPIYALEIVLEAKEWLFKNANPRLVIEVMFMRLLEDAKDV